ncbi:hypothetical protein [Streptomyces sp. NPDC018693]|uniref:hypothetical protein n=1 Tax=unclassified Streptomyces TaxID=2593676 RepID=UPI00379CE087
MTVVPPPLCAVCSGYPERPHENVVRRRRPGAERRDVPAPTVDARAHALAGDGTTNDQPAPAELVDSLGTAVREGRSAAHGARPRRPVLPAARRARTP